MPARGCAFCFSIPVMFLRYAIFFLVVSGLLYGVSWFVHRRLSADFRLGRRGRRILTAVLAGGGVAMVGSRWLERIEPSPLVHGVGLVGSVIMLGAMVAFAILLVDSLVRGLLRLGSRAKELVVASDAPELDDGEEEQEAGPVDEDRRRVLGQAVAASAVALGGGCSVYAAAFGRHDYVIEEVPIRLERLPRELDGYTLVQLSDLHLGLDVGDRELAAALELVSKARPDRIVLTGDLLDHDVRFAPMLGRFVRRLAERVPVSAVVGNHDYYAGIDESVETLRRAGADVLVNGSMLIDDRLVLGGVDDVRAKRLGGGRGPNVERAFAGTAPDLPRVLLCHNPSYYPEAAEHADLQLSGHTHGGQFSPLVNPARLVLLHGYIRGHYERTRHGDRGSSKSQLWVNRGFGTAGPPARIGSPPEVTKIVLTS
jgi:predicted MPP superfamily phosphohydrolase